MLQHNITALPLRQEEGCVSEHILHFQHHPTTVKLTLLDSFCCFDSDPEADHSQRGGCNTLVGYCVHQTPTIRLKLLDDIEILWISLNSLSDLSFECSIKAADCRLNNTFICSSLTWRERRNRLFIFILISMLFHQSEVSHARSTWMSLHCCNKPLLDFYLVEAPLLFLPPSFLIG